MSKSLIAQQKMIKTPPLLVMSKIKNYRTSSTHMTVCQCNWPISQTPPHWPPGRAEKKKGHHIWPYYDIKNFFQKKVKCTPCPKYWTVTSTLVTFEHSRKQQNVGYTDATIGCSLKQPKRNDNTRCINTHIKGGKVFLVLSYLPPAYEVCGKVMFLHASVILSTWGACMPRTPPCAMHAPLPPACPPPPHMPPTCTPPATHAPARPLSRYGQWAGGTHPTGMHPCY